MKLLLIGAGNMGGAMLQGLQSQDVTVVLKNEVQVERLKTRFPSVKTLTNIPSLDGYIVILAIKPQVFPSLSFTGSALGVISIMAGITLEQLRQSIIATSYVRAMPNMAATVQKSATSLCGDEALKPTAVEILNTIGSCFWLQNEKELDIAMGLAGCAPAWVALVAEALSDGAVTLGLKRDVTFPMIASLFEGMAEVLKKEHPAILKDKVMSPGGTTADGYVKLEEGKVRDSFIKAMEASYLKAKEFSKK